ncbi:MAG: 30S ribosomal protein S3 [Candidatus Nanoarchaeia archaeon]|nr:30S ribosomal protein S3 [Candidatus Haiyanarchaeum thermophilum]MCW1303104.1 30S ribosomal protein S3 [Candidatus Haiyanarchaeum thermophilum]MCW1303769.1 30S ribosomal protein S3 [Candidatus Haiyanarchaeum thermophilum]MCW1306616.1 30S ribosomal protein S3 [Candidatus Haiyanarchaeum thermophilum]MCW1307028.1 30S ribosomal protein S3 [Candidatus Haiyanarchaeum thermophilum]
MIERKFIEESIRELKVKEFLEKEFMHRGYSHISIQSTPVGHRIIIYTSRPGAVIGRGGENIERITQILKEKYKLENPKIDVQVIENIFLDPQIVAQKVCLQLARFGVQKFKAVGYGNLQNILNAGAIGAEIVISGKVPGSKAASWKFTGGYLPKSGYIADNYVLKAKKQILLPAGIIGVSVKILPPNVELPDNVKIKKEIKVEEVKEEMDSDGNSKLEKT